MKYSPPAINSCVSDGTCLRLFELAKLMDSIVEIGSWHGKSTHALLSGCKGTVYAVDHFQGSADKGDATHGQSGKAKFLEHCGNFSNLKLIEMHSDQAALLFEDNSIDMIFIDAGHLYEEVMSDFKCWYPKCKKVFCGHDYAMDTIKRALKDFGLEVTLPEGTHSHWEHYKGEPPQIQGEGDVAKQD